jgi:hypothetical protein
VRTRILRDLNDVYLQVVGEGLHTPFSFTQILDISTLQGAPPAVRLTDLWFSVEKGLAVFLWWEEGEDDGSLLLPIAEGQGRLDFSGFGGLHNPRNEGWTGHVGISTKQAAGDDKNFVLVLGFAKLRE